VAPTPFLVHLVSGRIGHDVSKRIDLGLLGSTMWSPTGGGRQSALGAEQLWFTTNVDIGGIQLHGFSIVT
jgi:hypothetical protein